MLFIQINLLGGAIFGIIYSFKFFYYIFFDFKKAKKIIYNHANNFNLKSKFYSNSNISSIYTISLFIIVAYILIIYLFFIFLNKNSLGDGFIVFSINNSKYEELIFTDPIFIYNLGYFN
jgi:hypothetical protein